MSTSSQMLLLHPSATTFDLRTASKRFPSVGPPDFGLPFQPPFPFPFQLFTLARAGGLYPDVRPPFPLLHDHDEPRFYAFHA